MMAGLGPVSGYKTVRELPGGDVIDVEYASTYSTPSGFGFAYALPLDAFLAGAAGRDLLLVIADELESLGANHHLTGSTGVQDLDENGLLADFVDATITLENGGVSLATNVLIPASSFFQAEPGIGGQVFTSPGGMTPADYADEAYGRLVALAGG